MPNKNEKSQKISSKEPVFIIRPANKTLGLDYLHISLIVLVIILIALAFALSTFKQSVVITNCQYGTNLSTNSTCNSTIHSQAQVLAAAKKDLAGYSNLNTSLALIPYYALVNQSQVSYLPQSKKWLVIVPYIDPLLKNKVFNVSFVLYDSNLSLSNSFLQTLSPVEETNDSVIALGTVNLAGESACKTTTPIPVYVVTDPYAPGALNALNTSINISRHYGDKINVTYFYIFGGYSEQYYSSFGIPQTQRLGQYLECASRQPAKFPSFLSNLSIAYTGRPIENQTLSDIEMGSGLNATQFGSCMDNVTTILNIQAQFAQLYNIVSTPAIIVNCRYSTIPQSMNYAINYSLDHLTS